MTLIKLQHKDSEDSFRLNTDYIVMFKKAYKGTRDPCRQIRIPKLGSL